MNNQQINRGTTRVVGDHRWLEVLLKPVLQNLVFEAALALTRGISSEILSNRESSGGHCRTKQRLDWTGPASCKVSKSPLAGLAYEELTLLLEDPVMAINVRKFSTLGLVDIWKNSMEEKGFTDECSFASSPFRCTDHWPGMKQESYNSVGPHIVFRSCVFQYSRWL